MIELVRIARGSFATAYLERGGAGRVFCTTDHPGHGKEVLARAAARSRSPHLPRVKRWGTLPAAGTLREREVWVMPYYQPLIHTEALEAWLAFTVLQKCAADAKALLDNDDIGALTNYQTLFYAKKRFAAGRMKVAPLIAALEVLVEEAADASEDYAFEFAPRNVAVDAHGRLVLLDVLYDSVQFNKLGDRDLWRREGRRWVKSHVAASPRRLVLP